MAVRRRVSEETSVGLVTVPGLVEDLEYVKTGVGGLSEIGADEEDSGSESGLESEKAEFARRSLKAQQRRIRHHWRSQIGRPLPHVESGRIEGQVASSNIQP